MKKVTISTLNKLKSDGKKFASITSYDASFSKLFEEAEVPVLLVGDSLGMVLQGHDSTIPVTVEDIAYHTKNVRAGNKNSLLMADMPFMSYANVHDACINAGTLMRAGANMVKIEGGGWLCETVRELTRRSVPVCVHLGLTPQSVNVMGGYKVQGRDQSLHDSIIADALALEEAGAKIILLECVTKELAEKITQALNVPVIGIGAGNVTDGQIMVMHDVLGISANYIPMFSKNFLEPTGNILDAIKLYVKEVNDLIFPAEEHTF